MQLHCDRRCDAFLTRAEGVHYRPKVDITHAVRITFRKERITQRNLICQVDKSGFFVGRSDVARTRDPLTPSQVRYQLRYTSNFSYYTAETKVLSILVAEIVTTPGFVDLAQ